MHQRSQTAFLAERDLVFDCCHCFDANQTSVYWCGDGSKTDQ